MSWPGWWCTIAVTVYDTGVCTGVCRSGWPGREWWCTIAVTVYDAVFSLVCAGLGGLAGMVVYDSGYCVRYRCLHWCVQVWVALPGWWCTIAVTVYDTGVCTAACRFGWPGRDGGVR